MTPTATHNAQPKGLGIPELIGRLLDQTIVNLLQIRQELLTAYPPDAPDFTLPRVQASPPTLSPAPTASGEPAGAESGPLTTAPTDGVSKAAAPLPKRPAPAKAAPARRAGHTPTPAPDRRITSNPARQEPAVTEFRFPRLDETTNQEERILGWRGVVRQILADASNAPHGRINTTQIRAAYCKAQGLDPRKANQLPEKVKNQIYIHTHELRRRELLKKDDNRNGSAVITPKGRQELDRLTRELEAGQPGGEDAAAAEAERPAFG